MTQGFSFTGHVCEEVSRWKPSRLTALLHTNVGMLASPKRVIKPAWITLVSVPTAQSDQWCQCEREECVVLQSQDLSIPLPSDARASRTWVISRVWLVTTQHKRISAEVDSKKQTNKWNLSKNAFSEKSTELLLIYSTKTCAQMNTIKI